MVSIQIDEQTAEAIESAASAAGISIGEFLKLLVPPAKNSKEVSWDILEREITNLSVQGTLPSNFSRSDIYTDHK